ncbi:SurA N-terminal domain-containing protein [Carboxydothermus hydrogenoformans]|uniref:Conserved domain protein n=1 Tax=Carboxydothermus hydrogenoformans (strain ATCC BAA-161 / DSM 6008 / Z-2901) TaxID=246194 RepID=Q3AEG7_CARHZ|nr:conserved domain protein [Carboxydothermus hydrogenoformans Z-2901]
MRRKGIFILLIVLIFLFLFFNLTPAAEILNDKFKQFGEFLKKVNHDKKYDVVVARIGDRDVTLREFELFKRSYVLDGRTVTPEEVLEELKRRTVLKEEAEKRKITVSDEEVEKAIQDYKEGMENLKKTNPAEYSEFLSYLEGLNMTEEQYWKSKEIFEIYRKALVTGKVRKAILKELSEKYNLTGNELQKKYRDYIEEEKAKLKVKILKPELIGIKNSTDS